MIFAEILRPYIESKFKQEIIPKLIPLLLHSNKINTLTLKLLID